MASPVNRGGPPLGPKSPAAPPPSSDTDPLAAKGGRGTGAEVIGQTIGHYVVDSLLGSGGMGHVYLARHERIGQEVALKILHADLARDPKLVRRFEDEAMAAARAGHRNIVQVFDFGDLPDGRTYFVMERLKGRSLTVVLAGQRQVPVPEALAIAREIALALASAHKAGVVHRDLKPDNVFMLDDDSGLTALKVLDFGIAKLQHHPKGGGVTETGTVFGTPQYMSPEQARGDGDVDGRADLYALGIILYEMLCGTVPFGGLPGEILARQVLEEPIDIATLRADLDPGLCKFVMKCLRKQREDRPATAREFVAQLDALGLTPARGAPGTYFDDTSSGRVSVTPIAPTDPSLDGLLPASGFARADSTGAATVTPGPRAPATPTASDGELLPTMPPGLRRGRWIGAIAAAIVALGLGFGGYVLLTGSGDDATHDEDDDDRAAAAEDDDRDAPPKRVRTAAPVPDTTSGAAVTTATPAPVVVAPVNVLVKTIPAGAALVVEGEPAPRGTTPLIVPVLPEGRLDVRLRLDGYEEAALTISGSGPPNHDVRLVAKPAAAKPRPKPKTADLDRTLKPSF